MTSDKIECIEISSSCSGLGEFLRLASRFLEGALPLLRGILHLFNFLAAFRLSLLIIHSLKSSSSFFSCLELQNQTGKISNLWKGI